MTKVVCTVSGGLDSATLLWTLKNQGHHLKALAFNYGQRHVRELHAAERVCLLAGVDLTVVDLRAVTPVIAGSSALVNPAVAMPEGHYAADNMKATVVPNRNMIFLAIAAGHAAALGFDAVAYGAHAGDHAIYPDCRVAFTEALGKTIALCDWQPLQLWSPFSSLTKAEVVRLGAGLGVPFADTWSCYNGRGKHCGLCGTCNERREAFQVAGVPDPTDYET